MWYRKCIIHRVVWCWHEVKSLLSTFKKQKKTSWSVLFYLQYVTAIFHTCFYYLLKKDMFYLFISLCLHLKIYLTGAINTTKQALLWLKTLYYTFMSDSCKGFFKNKSEINIYSEWTPAYKQLRVFVYVAGSLYKSYYCYYINVL